MYKPTVVIIIAAHPIQAEEAGNTLSRMRPSRPRRFTPPYVSEDADTPNRFSTRSNTRRSATESSPLVSSNALMSQKSVPSCRGVSRGSSRNCEKSASSVVSVHSLSLSFLLVLSQWLLLLLLLLLLLFLVLVGMDVGVSNVSPELSVGG